MSHTVSVIENKTSEKTFVFEGEFSIQSIENTKDEILNNLQNTTLIVLDINGVTIMDISFLQLLYSLIVHCEKNNISIQSVATALNDECKSVLSKSGFEKIICK